MKANTKAKIATAVIEQRTKNIYNPETGEMSPAPLELNSEVRWYGEPNYKAKWTKYELLFLPLSWLILLGSIFWMIALKELTFLYYVAVLLLLVGFYCVFIRNHRKKSKRKMYSYEMTDDDLTIIFTTKKDVKVRQLPIENIKYVGYSLRKGGAGTLYFNFPNDYKDIFKLLLANSGLGKEDERIFAFFEIADAEDIMEQLKSKCGENTIFEKI